MSEISKFVSPNYFVSCYFQEARQIMSKLPPTYSDGKFRHKIIPVIILCVSAVEAFLYIFVSIVAKKKNRQEILNRIEKEKNSNRSRMDEILDSDFPTLFDVTIDAHEFRLWKNLRNSLVHIKPDNLSITVDNIRIEGLLDGQHLDALTVDRGWQCIADCENLIADIGRLAGDENKEAFLRLWTGR
jgi:hypothetical protein